MPPLPSDNELLDGPLAGLTAEQNTIFLNGDIAFNDEVFTPSNGLGPLFVATSCGACHAGDGKGHPFSTLTRYGQVDETGNDFLDVGGPQLQNHAIPGFSPETMPPGIGHSKFTPPANTGLGFLESVTDAHLISLQDPFDLDGDGISGVVNWISLPDFVSSGDGSIAQNEKHIGRFGKKAAAFNLLHQTVNAYIQDMGITSDFVMQDLFHFNNGAFATDNIADPEVPAATVNNVVFYLQTLREPSRRNEDDLDVLAGKNIFDGLNCNGCHLSEMQTGFSPIEPLSYQVFYPYTDLLMHDMGSELDDGYTEGSALTSEWRTPPLWGLGLSEISQGGEYFLMHDGRAHSIEEAILMHGGEATQVREEFKSLSAGDKDKLILFLESL